MDCSLSTTNLMYATFVIHCVSASDRIPRGNPSMPRPFLTRCANCGGLIGIARTSGPDGQPYCSMKCFKFSTHPGWCESCLGETTSETIGNVQTVNLVGGRLSRVWGEEECPTCHSTIYRRQVQFVIPLMPYGPEFRVLWVSPSRYLSRKLRSQAASALPDWLTKAR